MLQFKWEALHLFVEAIEYLACHNESSSMIPRLPSLSDVGGPHSRPPDENSHEYISTYFSYSICLDVINGKLVACPYSVDYG